MAILTKKFISSLLKVILGQKLRIKLTGLHRDKPPTKQYLTPPAWELWYESQFIPNKIFKILSWISGALITSTVTLPSWAFSAFEARKVTTWGPTSFMVQITNPLKNGKKSVSLKIFYLSDLFFFNFYYILGCWSESSRGFRARFETSTWLGFRSTLEGAASPRRLERFEFERQKQLRHQFFPGPFWSSKKLREKLINLIF